MRKVYTLIEQVAPHLLPFDHGRIKAPARNWRAHAHKMSPRRDKPLWRSTVRDSRNADGIRTLRARERRFTGAAHADRGFELADSARFVGRDRRDACPAASKLLRVIEERAVRRLAAAKKLESTFGCWRRQTGTHRMQWQTANSEAISCTGLIFSIHLPH